jgi:tRNA(Ile)-lysidine synthase
MASDETAGEPSADAAGGRRPRLTPPIADVRRAVRGVLPPAGLVLVALSGGADSLALAAATAFEAPRAGLRAGAVIVDHGLQQGSAEVATRVAAQAAELGLHPVLVRRVAVAPAGEGGPEASARTARYAALDAAAHETGAVLVLLGHTLDDQAETVLLGLARGAGAASLSGMPERTGRYARPLLGIRRSTTRRACLDAGLAPWDDPHNVDSSYARVRVRERVLPVLESELGPGIAEALARTAEQLREDEAAFAAQIDEFIEEVCEPAEAGIAVSVGALSANPAALRQRIIRHVVASEFGASLTRSQTLEVARLVTDWHGQGAIDLPGCRAARVGGRIEFTAP